MSGESDSWFGARRYGWGWGRPRVWQGWAVLAVFFALVAAGVLLGMPSRGHLFFFGYLTVLCALLVLVCWVKGGSPKWRWRE